MSLCHLDIESSDMTIKDALETKKFLLSKYENI